MKICCCHSSLSQAGTCVKLCMQGLGMCFTPETYVRNMDLPVKPTCFSIGEDGVFGTLTIAYRRGTYPPPVCQGFYLYCEGGVVGFCLILKCLHFYNRHSMVFSGFFLGLAQGFSST